MLLIVLLRVGHVDQVVKSGDTERPVPLWQIGIHKGPRESDRIEAAVEQIDGSITEVRGV